MKPISQLRMEILKFGPFASSLIIALAYGFLGSTEGVKPSHNSTPFNRTTFPTHFIFGAGSAAYQSEGAAYIDGRGQSIWDTFTKKHPDKIWDGSTGDVADDFYHRYKGDVRLMKKVGLDSFRFSISWSRLLPKGKISGGINPLGVNFYNDIIDELLVNGIKPFVSLLHYDPPQALEDEYGGPLSSNFVDDFRDYADLCFKTFGDRVKYWVTMNEPNGLAINGYTTGTFAPGRCSNYVGNCSAGNSANEPYIVTHNLLLSHAVAVNLYKEKYQPYQKGKIGITIVSHWFEPISQSAASRKAASRAFDFLFGWYANPIIYGDYPESMRVIVGSRLPKFTKNEAKAIEGSLDFLGLNYYTANYASTAPPTNGVNASYVSDREAAITTEKNGTPIGTPSELNWLFIYPKGIRKILLNIKENYNDPEIFITENGMAYSKKYSSLEDSLRIRYHQDHLSYLLKAIKEGVKVKGYYAWSFWDDFEWDAGYTVGFGLTFVDFNNNLTRLLRSSAFWFKNFLLH